MIASVPNAQELAGPGLPDAGAWARFFARLFDLWWQIPLVSFVLAVIFSMASDTFQAWIESAHGAERFAFFCVPLAFVLDAVLVACFATSPGKAMLGLRVVAIDGARLTFGAALRRSLRVWAAGLAFTLVPLNLLAMAFQGWRLGKGRPSTYDRARYRVEARPFTLMNAVSFTCAVIALIVVLALIARPATVAGVPDTTTPSAAFTWTNPETGDAVTVPPGWEYRMLTGEDDLPLHEFQLSDGRAALLFSVQPAGVATLVDMTRDTNVLLEHVEMGSGRQESFLGSPSWAAEGFAENDTVTRLEVRVMHHDARYWRVMAAQDYPYRDSEDQVDALRELLWSSVKAMPPP